MTDILKIITDHKRKEVEERREATPENLLKKSSGFARLPFSLADAITNPSRTGIIAEFKRKSPSKGMINKHADVKDVTEAYTRYGASCLSVLTDHEFFGGSDADLMAARGNSIPILRKEFIIDEYQITEARAIGADAILLIAACLTPAEVKRFAAHARSLQLSVLLELHHEDELAHICDETDIIGINNRNLKTFEVDLGRSLSMAAQIPEDKIKVAESGIRSAADIQLFRDHGFSGFLIGESFMREADPGIAFRNFVDTIAAAKR